MTPEKLLEIYKTAYKEAGDATAVVGTREHVITPPMDKWDKRFIPSPPDGPALYGSGYTYVDDRNPLHYPMTARELSNVGDSGARRYTRQQSDLNDINRALRNRVNVSAENAYDRSLPNFTMSREAMVRRANALRRAMQNDERIRKATATDHPSYTTFSWLK